MKSKGSSTALLRELIVQVAVTIFLALIYGLIVLLH